MRALATALGLPFAKAATAAAVTYTRTAFVDSGATPATGVLNDPAFPYDNFAGAVDALVTAYPSQATTVRLMTNADASVNADADDMHNAMSSGLTIKSHDATVRTLTGTTSFGYGAGAVLTLSKVTIASLVKVPNTSTSQVVAGTITGDAQTTITALVLNGQVGNSHGGETANAGPTGTGTPDNPSQPAPDSSPIPGTDGGHYVSIGDDGLSGDGGGFGWSITLLGAGLVSDVQSVGGNSGSGGNGGNGGIAYGGNGGQGGDSNALVMEDGADGGRGGDATSTGGRGGDTGNGGDGGVITKSGGWTITAANLDGGTASSQAGTGGTWNNNTQAGSGGVGGAGAFLGATGDTGGGGTVFLGDGSAGTVGADGADGYIL